jgi:hypothetical protein
VRLPTGQEENLLGAGRAAGKVHVIGSVDGSRATSHVNIGYSFGGVSDEINYGGGLTFAAGPRVTLIGEVLGRRVDGLQRFRQVAAQHPRIAGVDTIRLLPTGGSTQTAFSVVGFKWNVSSTWLLSGIVLVPLTETGLNANVMPAVTLEYGFSR